MICRPPTGRLAILPPPRLIRDTHRSGVFVAPAADLTLLSHIESPVAVGHALWDGKTGEQRHYLRGLRAAFPVEQHADSTGVPTADEDVAIWAKRHHARIWQACCIDRHMEIGRCLQRLRYLHQEAPRWKVCVHYC